MALRKVRCPEPTHRTTYHKLILEIYESVFCPWSAWIIHPRFHDLLARSCYGAKLEYYFQGVIDARAWTAMAEYVKNRLMTEVALDSTEEIALNVNDVESLIECGFHRRVCIFYCHNWMLSNRQARLHWHFCSSTTWDWHLKSNNCPSGEGDSIYFACTRTRYLYEQWNIALRSQRQLCTLTPFVPGREVVESFAWRNRYLGNVFCMRWPVSNHCTIESWHFSLDTYPSGSPNHFCSVGPMFEGECQEWVSSVGSLRLMTLGAKQTGTISMSGWGRGVFWYQ